MARKKWLIRSSGLVVILAVVGICFLLFYDEDSDDTVTIPEVEVRVSTGDTLTEPGNTVDWQIIGDRNSDGEYNVLDMILYVQAGGG